MHYDLTDLTADELAEIERDEQAQAERDVAAFGIVAAIRCWQHEQREAELVERCLVAGFVNDPITRSASFDGFEMEHAAAPIRERCASIGCSLCAAELAVLAEPRQRAW